MSIKICKFPNALKYAELCPIFKKGSNLDVSNYRPVSILPSVSKIFEREIVNQLYMYFNPIFNPRLSGFRKQHSCRRPPTRTFHPPVGTLRRDAPALVRVRSPNDGNKLG